MQPCTPRSYALAVPTGDYPRKTLVPLYMVIHTVHGGATVDGVAQADAADLKAQGAHDVRYIRYWVSKAKARSSGRPAHRLRRPRIPCIARLTDWLPTTTFSGGGRVVIRRRLVANLVGPAVAGHPDETVAALPSRRRPSPRYGSSPGS